MLTRARLHLQVSSIVTRDRAAMRRMIVTICLAGALSAGFMVAALTVAPFVY